MPKTELPYVARWLKYKRDKVLDKFMSLPGAFTDGVGQERFVYVPGSRQDRCLIVAHADTVWGGLDIEMNYHKGVLFSTQRNTGVNYSDGKGGTFVKTGIGIGADDRAGCAMAWKLKDLGHSILITTGEEIGCVATKRIMDSDYWNGELNKTHAFAVELDRRGHKDIVFYDVGTDQFVDYVKKETGYTPERGFGTDIKYICKTMCGVNISVGYYNEHMPTERLVVPYWENTLCVLRNWLSKPLQRQEFKWSDRYYHIDNDDWNYLADERWSNQLGTTTVKKKEPVSNSIIPANSGLTEVKTTGTNQTSAIRRISCPSQKCFNTMTTQEWIDSVFTCNKRGTAITGDRT